MSNTNDAGPGSLRQAILDANFTIGRNTIAFAIPGDGVHTIQLSQSLPDLYNPVIIDGTTQPGYAGHPLIDLSGAEAGSAAAGLTLRYGNNTVKGLIIEGFSSYGIWLRFGNNNVVTGNYIGTDASGTAASPNLIGVEVDQSGDNTIGGAAAADHNLISGNQSYGIDGGGANNLITGNYIGTDLTGTVALPNSTGVRLSGFDNTVGGMESGAGNLVSGNTGVGVQLDGYNSRVAGNLIGTDAAGTAALGNGLVGMRIEGAYNTIGGLTAPARNLISGNMYGSIELGFGFFNLIQGNYIGTDVSGTTTLPDGSFGHGVLVNGDANTIGGKVAGAGNLIAGHSADGIGVGGIDNCVQGNFVGTDVTGTRALGNGVGIRLDDGLNNTIGGTSPGAGNLISGNHTGLVLGVYNRSGNVIQGNDIGTDVSGTAPLGNEYYGVDVEGPTFGMPSSTIGGEAAGAGNIIAFNGLAGLLVELDATGITIEGNAIFANGNLGIELRNGNHNQASPALQSATSDGQTTTVVGTLLSTPNTTFTLEFFANDPSDCDEGASFLGSIPVATDANGQASFTAVLDVAVDLGQFITATATDAGGNTSEFSVCQEVTGPDARGHSLATTTVAIAVHLPVQALPNPSQGDLIRDHRATAVFAARALDRYFQTSGQEADPGGRASGVLRSVPTMAAENGGNDWELFLWPDPSGFAGQ